MAFIAVEGIDGSGKSTLLAALKERLVAAGSTALGERVRELLLAGREELTPWAEICLFTAARAELVAKVVRPALGEGRTVLIDRFLWSTLAYQCYGSGVPLEPTFSLQRAAVQGTLPACVLWLDLPVATAMGRREGAEDRIEARGSAFLQRVREGFATLAVADPDRIHRLDATLPPQELVARAWERLRSQGLVSS